MGGSPLFFCMAASLVFVPEADHFLSVNILAYSVDFHVAHALVRAASALVPPPAPADCLYLTMVSRRVSTRHARVRAPRYRIPRFRISR